jgi:ferredoxin
MVADQEEASVRVEVDRELCESNAVCVGIAPDVFELGDDDLARVRMTVVPPDRETDVREAVALCPKIALTLLAD